MRYTISDIPNFSHGCFIVVIMQELKESATKKLARYDLNVEKFLQREP
jgi:hypothetical protein